MKYLQEEETLVERSLSTAEERLRKEQEWDRIRLEKESSVNSELTAQLQQREEQLIDMLKKMENDNKQQEAEIARLRQEVDKYEKKEENDNSIANVLASQPDREQEQIQIRINEKAKKRADMYLEVERLRQLRKQQELDQEKRAKEQQEEMERVNRLRIQEEEEIKRKRIEFEEEEAKRRVLRYFSIIDIA